MKNFKQKTISDYAYPIIIVIVAMIIVGIIAAVVYKKRDKVEAQRTAKVIEINGPCTILREGAILDAVADMPLYSGDTFYSGIDASARIMIDEDKFLYLDSATRINFTATGTPDETHTMIYVQTGSMLTEVKEKLVDGESFDIVTPNTFMEIHGTKTLTCVNDVNGKVTTSTAVIEGNVGFNTVAVVNGRTVCIPSNILAGGSLSVSIDADGLVGEVDMMSIANTGVCLDGNLPDSSTFAEAGIVTGEHEFTDQFLDNVEEVLAQSEQEDNANGMAWNDSDGNGVNDTKENVDALRKIENTKVVDAEETARLEAEEAAARQAAAEEAAARLAAEEAEKKAEEEAVEAAARAAAEAAARQAAEEVAALQAAQEEAARLAAEQEAALLAAEEEAARRAEQEAKWEREAREEAERAAAEAAARAAAEAASQSNPDIPPVPDVDPAFGGTYTGYYSIDGFPLYLNSDEHYYFVDGDEMIEYDSVLLPPPSEP